MLKIISLMLIAAVTTACVSTLPPAPAKSGVSDYKYLVGPGDDLRIDVYRHPEMSGVFPVRPDGMLATPLLDEVPAAGKSPEELARDIERQASKLVQNPRATVVVMKSAGAAGDQVKVIGQVAKPATIAYRRNMTLLDALMAVGGVTDYAAGNRAVLIRQGDGGKQYNVRVRDLLKGGDVSANVELQPGDVIVIPESWL